MLLNAEEARELSSYKCENLSVDDLIDDIDKYIKITCSEKKIEMYYIADKTKYTLKTVKKAIKILKHNGYNAKICKNTTNKNNPNYPSHIELFIRWW